MRMRNRTDGIVPLTENMFPQFIVVLTSFVITGTKPFCLLIV